jgi:hypothetical protein
MNCNKCFTEIIDGVCSCGSWYEKELAPEFAKTLKKAIEEFNFINEQKQIGDLFGINHYSGTCIILFKGNYYDLQRACAFIRSKQLFG